MVAEVMKAMLRTRLKWVVAVLVMVTMYGAEAGTEEDKKDPRFVPYASDPNHLWNQLHQALFVRNAADGSRVVHSTDPLLYRGGKYLLEGEPHRRALALLDRFRASPGEPSIDHALKRLFFQRDLWAAFDYAAWYPDDWVFKSRYEPAAIALRKRLARAVGRLALRDAEFKALPDNYALAVKSKRYATDHDPKRPDRPFLPPDLFDLAGPWVRFDEVMSAEPMASLHFAGATGRAVHVIFLRLPAGRAATEEYLKGLNASSIKQFPPGTMVAMVRRPMTVSINKSAKVRVTPITELVQIRVYRQIPRDREPHVGADPAEQDVYEFLLDRTALFAGKDGLRAVGPKDPAEPFFDRSEMRNPFEGVRSPLTAGMPQLKTCIQCHSQPGIHSVLSMQRGLKKRLGTVFRTYAWDVEMGATVSAKVKQFNWGLLQGILEAK
jgi:hypothetical protein